MLVNIYLSDSAFARLVKLRLLAEFRPVDEPLRYRETNCWMDGLDLRTVDLLPSPRRVTFAPHTLLPNGTVGATPDAPTVTVPPVTVRIGGAVLLASVDAVRVAGEVGVDGRYGLPDRPERLQVPIIGAELDTFLTVDPTGVPRLHLPVRVAPGTELLGGVPTFLGSLADLNVPFPVGAAFAGILPPGRTRVLNAGLARVGDGVTIRLEFEPAGDPPGSVGPRLTRWQEFFAGGQPSQLAGRDWAIDLPANELASNTARALDEQFGAPAVAKYFTSTREAWGTFAPDRPGFDFHKDGVFEGACGGLDIRATIEPTVTLSVPVPNTLRASVDIDVDLDDWDAVKCTMLSLINPFAGLITTVDLGLPWWAWPIVSLALPVAPIAFGLGGDDLVINEVVKAAQDEAAEEGTQLVRTGDTTFYVDTTQRVTTPLTRDWLTIDTIRGTGDRLVIAGGFGAPELSTLPRLRGSLASGFGSWSKVDRCSTNVRWQTTATVVLAVEDAAGHPVRRPDPSVRYGIDIESVDGKLLAVGQTTWRVVDDPLGVYRGQATLVHWSGVPGVYEVRVTQPPEPFRSHPYPMRIQIFTSVGVREFEIPAPPPVPPPPATREEELAAAAERVATCYLFATLLTRVKALQVVWLPNPQPRLRSGQHWQVVVRGLGERDWLRAWDAESRELLAEVRPYAGGLTELSVVLPSGQEIRALQLTPGDAEPLDQRAYAETVAGLRGVPDAPEGPHPVAVRQTTLYPAAGIALGSPADALTLIRGPAGLSLYATGPAGIERLDVDPLNLGRVPVRTLVAAAAGGPGVGLARRGCRTRGEPVVVPPARPPLPAGHQRLVRVQRGDRTVVELTEPAMAGEARTVGRYLARPWFDRGGVAGRWYAQLSDDGTMATLYLRGVTRDVPPDIGDRGLPHGPGIR